ncbi:MAG: hypothetical protein R3F20_10195 [Planctomycetota bacterium]
MKVLLDKLDWVTLAVVLAACALVAFTGAGTGRERAEPALESLATARVGLQDRLTRDLYDATPGAAVLAEIDAVEAERNRLWNPDEAATRFEGGFFHHAPSVADLREGRETEIRFPAPRGLRLEAEIGEIRVAWDRDDLGTVLPIGYVVYRREGAAERRRLARLESHVMTYVDRAVVPGVLYGYEVTALTDDPVLIGRGREESEPSRGAQIRARRDYEIGFLAFEGGKARLKVRKFVDGVWHEKEFDAGAGDEIGVVDAGSGIDYRTNSRVEAFDEARDEIEETREEVVLDEAGHVVMKDDQAETVTRTFKRPRTVVTLTLRNELGQRESLTLTK